jgi:alanyl-tRNA synthetase
VTAEVDVKKRQATALNHSATHLLHKALQQVLGSHVEQKGSLVDASRLRFDFTHTQPMTAEQILAVEAIVNEQIRLNVAVETQLMTPEQAVALGAMALFGEKYGEVVRVLSMGEFSKELCGGTHAKRTGDIGLCKIVSEVGIAAGIRRIEALTGEAALQWLFDLQNQWQNAATLLKTNPKQLLSRLEQLLLNNKQQDKQLAKCQSKLVTLQAQALLNDVQVVAGVKVLMARVDDVDSVMLKALAEYVKAILGSSLVLLLSSVNDRVQVISMASTEVSLRCHVGKLVAEVAAAVDGKGGGRPEFAQAAGTNKAAMAEALEIGKVFIKAALL